LKEYLIGAGGWAYFKIPGLNSLVAYSRAFNFVEVNTTFYEIPAIKTVEKWRKIVPVDFRFSVKTHHSITHENKLMPSSATLKTFRQMLQICEILDADVLHLQTPPTFVITAQTVKNLRDLLGSLTLGRLRLALEFRSSSQLPSELTNLMQEQQIIHCVDLSKNEKPAYESDILYTRLFGKGRYNLYQPTDEELVEVDKHILFSKSERAMVSFHFIKMYQDAARLKIYKQTGKFPSVTHSTGLRSLEEVLRENASFPLTKQNLLENYGWKLFDHTRDKRIHAADVLTQLPEKTYENVHDVITSLATAS
jgi:uncharacterized protein YecE (DUF72 family)